MLKVTPSANSPRIEPGSASGYGEAAWDATDGARRVPAGLYFVRYEVPGKTSVRRLIVTP